MQEIYRKLLDIIKQLNYSINCCFPYKLKKNPDDYYVLSLCVQTRVHVLIRIS